MRASKTAFADVNIRKTNEGVEQLGFLQNGVCYTGCNPIFCRHVCTYKQF